MKCPSCGRLDFEGSESCPRCGEPMPPGSGEFSGDTSSSMEAPADYGSASDSSPGPLFQQAPPPETAAHDEPAGEDTAVNAGESPGEDSAPSLADDAAPDEEQADVDESSAEAQTGEDELSGEWEAALSKSALGDDSESMEGPVPEGEDEELPPVEANGEQGRASDVQAELEKIIASSAGEKGEESPPARKEKSPSQPVPPEKAGKQAPPARERPVFKEGGAIVPEPYAKKDSATFSSELGTDWIDKYARAKVIPNPARAGFGMRAWGFVTDWMLLLAMGVVILLAGRLAITLLGDKALGPWEIIRHLAVPTGGVWLVVAILYFTLFTAITGQTPGKMAMDMRVAGPDGHPPTIGKALIRCLVYFAGLLLLGLGFWWALTNDERRTWHDMAAGTTVFSIIHKGK